MGGEKCCQIQNGKFCTLRANNNFVHKTHSFVDIVCLPKQIKSIVYSFPGLKMEIIITYFKFILSDCGIISELYYKVVNIKENYCRYGVLTVL